MSLGRYNRFGLGDVSVGLSYAPDPNEMRSAILGVPLEVGARYMVDGSFFECRMGQFSATCIIRLGGQLAELYAIALRLRRPLNSAPKAALEAIPWAPKIVGDRIVDTMRIPQFTISGLVSDYVIPIDCRGKFSSNA